MAPSGRPDADQREEERTAGRSRLDVNDSRGIATSSVLPRSVSRSASGYALIGAMGFHWPAFCRRRR